jgi:uncharacterized membrane protein YbhN (UPF0104 family)
MRGSVLWWAAVATLALSGVVVARALDPEVVAQTLVAARADPWGAVVAVVLYVCAFAARAGVWSLLVPELAFPHALAALHVSLGANHVLPFRLGEALRITTVVRRTRVTFGAATASTVALRAGDMVAVVGLATLFGPRVVGDVVGARMWLLLGPALALFVAGVLWLGRVDRSAQPRARGSLALVGVAAAVAWVLESAVLWHAARWAGLEVSFLEAVLVTAVTIAAQAVAIAPAGLGTYEAAATATLVSLGAEAAPALAAALTAHALKTAYALLTGAAALFWPAPGVLGRLRLARASACAVGSGNGTGNARASGPVVLFLPARDEEPAVAGVVERVPATVLGRRVVTVVVDDGSGDGTAAAAAAAGAEVVSLPHAPGLGAAVRTGLQEATARGAAAVAFCDADGEYAPEELERLVGPVLGGTADYVVGTRFGRYGRRWRDDNSPPSPRRLRNQEATMLAHRRAGNLLLTRLLSFIARTPISDGQSGFRALSAAAARDAEIVHDFNYAQVLTLDLVAKGYRYAEVPISYRHRTTGRSFVRLAAYLGAVAPAVHREVNDLPGVAATLSPRPRG